MEKDYLKYINDIPVVPDVAVKVFNIAEDGLDISFKELENIIKIDPGLTTKVLKVANSALYARQKEIQSLQMAITLLGFKNLKSLVLLVIASKFFQKVKGTEFYQIFWKHAIITAFTAKIITVKCSKQDISDNAFTCGLLHNMGKAVLFNADPDRYMQLLEKEKEMKKTLHEYEEEDFGVNHKTNYCCN